MKNQIIEDSAINSGDIIRSLILESKKLPTLKLQNIVIDGYERVIEVTEEKSGLHAFIALHNTKLGPALGGIRIYPYATREAALEDVLRLSKGMTYKSAIAGVGCGGGKSVIIADPKKQKTPELLMAFGTAVEMLEGIYICAEDVGCTTEDVKVIRKATRYVVGLPHERSSGDPGYFTAWGVFRGIQSAVQKIFGSASLEGKKVAVQGLGNVGRNLIDYLFWAGADLILSDIDPALLSKYGARYGAKTVPPEQILQVECDVLAPCALGGILNDATIPLLRCRAVAGAANNQLLRDSHGDALRDRGILYAPDFVINAGGLLNVAAEIEERGYCPTGPRNKCLRIYDTLLSIYAMADATDVSTNRAAITLADEKILQGIGKRVSAPVFHHSAE